MSTELHIDIDPSEKTPLSVRERYTEVSLPAPFTELPFDVGLIANRLARDQDARDQENLSSVGSLKFTVRFGRPL